MADTDLDGGLNEDEVKEIIALSASANKLDKIKNQAREYATLIMEELDPYDRGYIMGSSPDTGRRDRLRHSFPPEATAEAPSCLT